jgi:uncharacterized protein YpmS|tara:strand:+ start:608 stop:781 length:174 start_codon:yes stop_codon:yes gene_type:complete
MKVLKIIFLTLVALVILLIILAAGVYVSCDSSNPKRVEVVVPSELIGKAYTESPLAH